MSAPPEANTEYSRASEASEGLLARISAPSSAPREGSGTAVAAVAFAVYRKRSRTALVALVVLGIVTLLISLLGELPDAHATGIVGSGASQYAEGTSTPSAGPYAETLA